MHKQKVHKGVKKRRMRITRKGKVLRRVSGRNHLMSPKPGKKRRRLRRTELLHGGELRRAKRLLAKR